MIKGAHAIVVISALDPDKLVAARLGNAGGVAVGFGQGEMFIATDIPAILPHTQDMILLESEESPSSRPMARSSGSGWGPVPKSSIPFPGTRSRRKKAPIATFMQKEIYEQAQADTHAIGGRVDFEQDR